MSVAVIALIVVACVVVIWLLRKRLGRFVVDAKKKKIEIEADNPPSGVRASEIESESEKVDITDETGSGVDAAKVRAYKDVSITNKLPPKT